MKQLILSLSLLFSAVLVHADAGFEDRKTVAEEAYLRRSFGETARIYQQAADQLTLNSNQLRWARFRIADATWRAQSATAQMDPTAFQQARDALTEMVRIDVRDAEEDAIRAEIHESLGDSYLLPRQRDPGSAWPHYERALDWWAGQTDLTVARARYLGMVRKLALQGDRSIQPYGLPIPFEVIEKAASIAVSPEDRAWTHYLLAVTARIHGGGPDPDRIRKAFETAAESGRNTPWYDDALFQFAQWTEESGASRIDEEGSLIQEPDFVAALVLYKRILREFDEGESRYREAAKSRIDILTSPALSLSVDQFFLPESAIAFRSQSRNIQTIEFALYPVELAREVDLSSTDQDDWLETLPVRGKKAVQSWKTKTADDGRHRPEDQLNTIDQPLESGAYLLVARGGKKEARELILVTRSTLALKTGGGSVLAWFCNALDGTPHGGAAVTLWRKTYDGTKARWERVDARTDTNGIATYTSETAAQQLLAFSGTGAEQAFAAGHAWFARNDPAQSWRIQAFTDRPAYRPGDTIFWKCQARTYDGLKYATPAGQALRVTVRDPRGQTVLETNAQLNVFGSAWGSLSVTKEMPLGLYPVTFEAGGRPVGSAMLFRLEEYKLPEFQVSVSTPREDGRAKAFLLGERVEAEVKASYYSGGAVAGAEVVIVVRKRPHYRFWCAPVEFGWLTPPARGSHGRMFHGGEEIVKQEQLQTDAAGLARIAFDTEPGGPEMEYTIEARVTDASRREITGRGSVRVGQQRYFVHATPEQRISKPGKRMDIVFRALDPDNQPLSVTGKVKVARLVWRERWINPLGQPVEGPALRSARIAGQPWPPPPQPGRPPWVCVTNAYEEIDVRLDTVVIPTNGSTTYSFTPDQSGYYLLRWQSPQLGGRPVRVETPVWATTSNDVEIGYRHHDGVELIVDRSTFRPGETAGVMIVTPDSGRHVLFTLERERVLSHRVEYLEGHSRWIPISLDESHVPNLTLAAACFSDAQLSMDQVEVTVPPVQHYLNVTVETARAAYQPRDTVELAVKVTDHRNQPVKAEIAFGLADEAIQYIQEDLAGDPRAFYFGELRPHQVSTWHSFNQRRLARYTSLDEEEKAAAGGQPSMEYAIAFEGLRMRKSSGNFADTAPMAMAAPAGAMMVADAVVAESSVSGIGGVTPTGDEGDGAVQVRSDFRATAFWQPDLVTDEEGRATVQATLPDSLTRWQAKARVLTAGAQFGIASNAFEARLPVQCRLQTPRFLVAGDTGVVRAVVQNQTDESLKMTHTLEVEGLELKSDRTVRETVPARGEVQIDWTVVARQPGAARVVARSKSDAYSDGMERRFDVHDHGLDQLVAVAMRSTADVLAVSLVLPEERREGTTRLDLRVTPSLAASLLDALPYLADYPYGCTEQTLSRFVPAVVVAKTLRDLGWDTDAVARRMPTIQSLSPTARTNQLDRLPAMIQAGLDRLYDSQREDGSWGWWKESGADPYMTAYVLWGLSLAREAGVDVRNSVLDRGLKWLDTHLVDAEEDPDLQAWVLHALAAHRRASDRTKQAMDNLWEKRDQLHAQGRAHYLLALTAFGSADRARIVAENLRDGVSRDEAPGESLLGGGTGQPGLATARWGASGFWWRWSESPVESTAFALKALLAARPDDDLIDPAMHWLVRNRRGTGWSNTRDTAISLLALSDYLRVRKEVRASLDYTVEINGKTAVKGSLPSDRVLEDAAPVHIDPALLISGTNQIRILRTGGSGTMYVTAQARYFSEEEPVKAAGSELFVKRQYYRITSQPTLLKGVQRSKQPLGDLEMVESGDRIEVAIYVETKNDYTYLLLEDLKPAGFESVEVRSGGGIRARHLTGPAGQRRFAAGLHDVDAADYTGREGSLYPEFRDRTTALFAERLDQGIWEIRYELRAETPGHFHALPITGHAMYAPDIRANGTEVRVQVKDAP